MTITAAVNVTLKIDDSKYNISLGIPSAAPSAAAPYTFSVTSATSGTKGDDSKLLDFAVGGTNEVYVAVSPPESIISSVPVVEDLSVVINEGHFDPTTGKFTSS